MANDLSYSSLIGQEKAKTLLSRVFETDKMAHAYLFRGPGGVGKKLTALLTAARVNCLDPGLGGACSVCTSCQKLRSGNHPDIVLVSPENGVIKIDRIRELCRSLAFPPYESTMRVVIIEDVHTMTPEAANSLLKTLEEPPEKNLLILTAELSRELLPTIVSRCQVVTFYGLQVDECVQVVQSQRPELGSDEIKLLAELTDGSPGMALMMQQKGLVKTYRSVVELLGPGHREDLGSITPVLQMAAEIAALKEDLPLLLGLLRIRVRDLMIGSERDGSFLVHNHRLAALDRAQHQLERNCNRTLVCEVLLFNLQSPMAEVF